MTRNFSFGRTQRNIEQKSITIPNSSPKSTWRKKLKKQFNEHIITIKNMSNHLNTTIDHKLIEDIYRGQLSFLMSSYDHLIHRILFYKIIDIYNDESLETPQYKDLKISISSLKRIINNPKDSDWLEFEIEKQFGEKSFINPYTTLNIFSLLTTKNLLENYCNENNLNYSNTLRKLLQITKRRNQIVHNMDISVIKTGKRAKITLQFVEDSINLINNLGTYFIDNI